jgi:DnaJ-class molecular chaperone
VCANKNLCNGNRGIKMIKGKQIIVTCPACYGKHIKDCKRCKGKGVVTPTRRL